MNIRMACDICMQKKTFFKNACENDTDIDIVHIESREKVCMKMTEV